MRFLLIAVCAASVLIPGCSAYKPLKPKAPLSPAEQGYIPLTKDQAKTFELKKGKKYFVAFPAPTQENFYIVLHTPLKKKITASFSAQLAKKKRPGPLINDDARANDSLYVYPVGTKAPQYYWFIEGITENTVLGVQYRYAPQWRFKFETRHASFSETLEANRVEREAYTGVGTTTKLETFNYITAIDTVGRRTDELNKVYRELLDIESIFPKDIVNSTDKAYQDYISLRKNIEEEIAFQKAWSASMNFFNKLFKNRNDPAALLRLIDDYITYFRGRNAIAANVIKAAQAAVNEILATLVPFYDQRLTGKTDEKPFDPTLYMLDRFYRVDSLYVLSGVEPSAAFSALNRYIRDFDARSLSLAAAKDSLGSMKKIVAAYPDMPPNGFFAALSPRVEAIARTIPQPIDDSYGKYLSFAASVALNQEIGKGTAAVGTLLGQFRDAETVVNQLNGLKMQRQYSTMLGLLLQNAHLGFLLDKYKALDRMSVDEQVHTTRLALDEKRWPAAEAALTALFRDQNFLNPPAIVPVRNQAVDELENALYSGIDAQSRQRVMKFCDDNVKTLENIDSLYADSVFLPAYNITFTSGNRAELVQRKNELIAHLAKLKDNEFPARAIKLLYDEFLRTPDDNGVLKARAIVAHGERYTGDDKDIKMRMAESNPQSAKWIVKPKEYRRVFALPVTDGKKGKNKYIVRLIVNIPTDAQFPVYDINIKLPKEVAQNAATQQWYDEIKLNKAVLKNEGRFSISAPTASSDWECQITPVQMNKDKNNILEIAFSYPAFKAFPISVMVQKPIIKKN